MSKKPVKVHTDKYKSESDVAQSTYRIDTLKAARQANKAALTVQADTASVKPIDPLPQATSKVPPKAKVCAKCALFDFDHPFMVNDHEFIVESSHQTTVRETDERKRRQNLVAQSHNQLCAICKLPKRHHDEEIMERHDAPHDLIQMTDMQILEYIFGRDQLNEDLSIYDD